MSQGYTQPPEVSALSDTTITASATYGEVTIDLSVAQAFYSPDVAADLTHALGRAIHATLNGIGAHEDARE